MLLKIVGAWIIISVLAPALLLTGTRFGEQAARAIISLLWGVALVAACVVAVPLTLIQIARPSARPEVGR